MLILFLQRLTYDLFIENQLILRSYENELKEYLNLINGVKNFYKFLVK
jgi:hypothetical protein